MSERDVSPEKRKIFTFLKLDSFNLVNTFRCKFRGKNIVLWAWLTQILHVGRKFDTILLESLKSAVIRAIKSIDFGWNFVKISPKYCYLFTALGGWLHRPSPLSNIGRDISPSSPKIYAYMIINTWTCWRG